MSEARRFLDAMKQERISVLDWMQHDDYAVIDNNGIVRATLSEVLRRANSDTPDTPKEK